MVFSSFSKGISPRLGVRYGIDGSIEKEVIVSTQLHDACPCSSSQLPLGHPVISYFYIIAMLYKIPEATMMPLCFLDGVMTVVNLLLNGLPSLTSLMAVESMSIQRVNLVGQLCF